MAIDERGVRALATPTPASLRYVFPDDYDEIIYGTAQAETLTGDDEGQWIFGLGGSDRLFGKGGDDYLDGGGGDDYFDGGEGSDTLLYTVNTTPVRVDFTAGLVSFPGKRWAPEAFTAIENVHTGSGDDIVLGSGASNAIFTHDGHDLLRGGAGDDWLEGGEGHDRLFGDAGADRLLGGAGRDRLWGGDGDDILDGGGSNDRLDGGRGSDTVLYAANTTAVHLNLAAGIASFPGQRWAPETLVSIENAVTGSGDDRVIGSRAANTVATGAGEDYIATGPGNDRIEAGDGNDWLLGGGGDDVLIGGRGRDFLNGGAGTDTAVYLVSESPLDYGPFDNSAENITADLALGEVRANGEAGEIREVIHSVENITTGWGNDIVVGSAGDNVIRVNFGTNEVFAGAGDDIVYGGAASVEDFTWRGFDSDFEHHGDYLNGGSGNDILYAGGASVAYHGNGGVGSGVDVLNGGRGDDILVAGTGRVSLTGGIGADEFRFSAETAGRANGPLEYYTGQSVTVTDFAPEDGDSLLINILDYPRPQFVGTEVETIGEYAIFRQGEDLRIRYAFAEETDFYTEDPYLIELDVTLADYAGTLTQDDIFFI